MRVSACNDSGKMESELAFVGERLLEADQMGCHGDDA
jgi:hypothetical protein